MTPPTPAGQAVERLASFNPATAMTTEQMLQWNRHRTPSLANDLFTKLRDSKLTNAEALASITDALTLAVAQERERCARVAEEFTSWPPKRKFTFQPNSMTGSSYGDIDTAMEAASQIVAAIRAGT